MAWFLFEDIPTDFGRFCCECGEFHQWEDYYRLKHGRNGRQSICKLCKHFHSNWRRRYLRHNTRPLECQECGDDRRVVQVDHDHVTMQFRAWLCSSCNLRARRVF